MLTLSLFMYIVLFFLWAVFGSFAGVIIERWRGGFEFERLPEILWWRSYCPGCIAKNKLTKEQAQLKRWQLIPLVGWLMQRGKCYRCESNIPAWYMWFEIVMGIAFVWVALLLGTNAFDLMMYGTGWMELLFWIFVVRAWIGIFIADILRYELNVWLRLFLIIWIVGRSLTWFPIELMAWLKWMAILTAIFFGIYQFGKWYVKLVFDEIGEWFGFGDVMMAVVVGLLFPLIAGNADRIAQVQLALVYLVVSCLVGMWFRAIRRMITQDKDNMMPFLPAMMIGFVLVLVRGEVIVGWL